MGHRVGAALGDMKCALSPPGLAQGRTKWKKIGGIDSHMSFSLESKAAIAEPIPRREGQGGRHPVVTSHKQPRVLCSVV